MTEPKQILRYSGFSLALGELLHLSKYANALALDRRVTTSVSLDELFTANEPRIYRFLLRLCQNADLAADLTQETLAIGWQRRSQLRERDAFTTWLFRIANNTFCEHLRRRDKQQQRGWEQLDTSSLPSNEPEPGLLSSAEELGKRVWDAMSELPQRQSQVLHLRVVEQLSTLQIADVLNITPQAVRSNLSAARKQMRQRLGDAIDLPTNPKAIG